MASGDFQVFLSFRGPDTRQGFTDCIYNIMTDAGIRVFRDDDELSAGEKIDKILLAVKNSTLCIPVFSRTFASSAWCLREVAEMVNLGKQIIPIFLDVTPDDVKLRTQVYRDEMPKHEAKHGRERVMKWEEALKEVAGIKGRELKGQGYFEFSKELTREVLLQLRPSKKHVPDHLTGMDEKIDILMKMLDRSGPGGVRYIGIHGMGGIGKTTLAKILFNKLSTEFEGCCFLADVRETSRSNGVEHLLKELVGKLDPKLKDLTDIIESAVMIMEKFLRKKVLIILDDVEKEEQIDRLVGHRFGTGSRIIVTTRNVGVLRIGVKSFDEIFEVKEMSLAQSHQLFNHHAFGSDPPPRVLESLAHEIVRSCKGLPLALEVLGSFLCRKDKSIWAETVKKVGTMSDRAIHDKLRISYDALEHEQQQIFLDIACFFIGTDKSYAMYMWDACGFHPVLTLDNLVSMSLIKVLEDGKLWMNDFLRDLGREIVREQGLRPPRKCSRLWGRPEEVMYKLNTKEGNEEIAGLRFEGQLNSSAGNVLAGLQNLRLPSMDDAFKLSKHLMRRFDGQSTHSAGQVLAGLQNLRLLWMDGAQFSKHFKLPLPQLRWLSWGQCPSSFDALYLNLKEIVILELPNSSISENWNGWTSQVQMVHLKVLDLTNCCELKYTPDFSRMPNLERLILRQCKKLVELHISIGNLIRLKYLDASHCSSLVRLPEEIGCLESLEEMSFHGCKKLRNFPESIGKLKSLVALDLAGKQNSFDKVFSLSGLMLLGSTTMMDEGTDLSLLSNFYNHSITGHMRFTGNLLKDSVPVPWQNSVLQLPNIFIDLKLTTKLDLSYLSVESLPDSIGNLDNLRVLMAKRSSLATLPKSIGRLKKLEILDLRGSFILEEIPREIGGLYSLRMLDLSGTSIYQLPSTINELSLLRSLNLHGCRHLGEPQNATTSLANEIDETPQEIQRTSDLEEFALPPSFGDFHQLEVLSLNCKHLKYIPILPPNLRSLALEDLKVAVKPSVFSKAENLTYLCIVYADKEMGYENLAYLPESLKELRLIGLQDMTPDLSNLKNLRKLVVLGGKYLREIPGLGKLEALEELDVSQCESLDSLENLSELRRLKYISIILCPKLSVVEGLDRLVPHLIQKDVHFGDCNCAECILMSRLYTTRQLLSWVNSEIGICLSPSNIPVRLQHYLGSKDADESH